MSTNGRWRRPRGQSTIPLKLRILAAALWCYFAWYGVALTGHTIGGPVVWATAPVIGVLVSLAVALRVHISPRSTRDAPAT